jgi:uncharacterized membrane protein
MKITVSKILSIPAALAYTVFLIVNLEKSGSVMDLFLGVLASYMALVLPMVCIWFPEYVALYTGSLLEGFIADTPTPPFLVSIMGWVILGIPVLAYLLTRYSYSQ